VSAVATTDEVRAYWERHIHDLEITRHPAGSRGFFDDLDEYHFDQLHHLLRLVDFNGYRGKAVLEVGCGAASIRALREGRRYCHRRGSHTVRDRSRHRQFFTARVNR
jgi:hypothetical protein